MNITSVLVANRGEIARRIIKACRDLGLATVAVYSDADRDAPFVGDADMAVHIGESSAAASYLDGEKLIKAAKRAGADAVHPGYGFLAENAEFAEQCIRAGLKFVGPSPENIRLMGSKITAKAAAVAAKVPVVPGYYGDDQSLAVLKHEAERIATPLLIKASAGGGGRGMRQVHDLKNFEAELKTAKAEATAAFGNDQVLLERYIGKARHIEVQVLGDRAGNVVHLFERDCSLQRNHQKVIEEAPAPDLCEKTRDKILDCAVKLACNIKYDSAGTCEFLLDSNTGEFYFLEMNTRLQVEHPVSEIITGIDLVEWQLRIAGGELLPFRQKDISCKGWAIEARLAAENPAQNYAPETGVVECYREPKIARVRIDSGIAQGSQISHYYDSLLAKIIASGPDRPTAIRNLKCGLGEMVVVGFKTNQTFLGDLLASAPFQAGLHNTATIEDIYPNGWQAPEPSALNLAQAVLARHLHTGQTGNSQFSLGPWTSLGSWRVTEPSGRTGAAIYWAGDETVRAGGRQGNYQIEIGKGEKFNFDNATLADDRLSFESDGVCEHLFSHVSNTQVILKSPDGIISVEVLAVDDLTSNNATSSGEGNLVTASMPGQIVETLVSVGDQVEEGQSIVVLEAMKLLQQLPAPCDGVIAKLNCKSGETVQSGAVLAVIESEE